MRRRRWRGRGRGCPLRGAEQAKPSEAAFIAASFGNPAIWIHLPRINHEANKKLKKITDGNHGTCSDCDTPHSRLTLRDSVCCPQSPAGDQKDLYPDSDSSQHPDSTAQN